MGREHQELVALGTNVAVVGPRGASAAALAATKLEAPYLILADPGRAAYRAYGFTKSLWVIQQSGWIVIDPSGIVRAVHRATDPRASLEMELLIASVSALGAT